MHLILGFKINTKYLSFIVIILIISSCTLRNNTSRLINTIDTDLATHYHLKNGNLVAIYDLAKMNKNTIIYSSDLVRIINEDAYNKHFLNKLKSKLDIKRLESFAAEKIKQIKLLLTKLHNRYHFLSQAQLKMFSHNKVLKTNNMLMLADLDKTVSAIPILLPEYQPLISSYYGNRKDPCCKKIKMHCGLDLVCKKSGAIYAAANGKVIKVMKNNNGYGNAIEIMHSVIFKTRYAHLKNFSVKEGDFVLRGQKIGVQGHTGNATGEHLHFEILVNEKRVNPFDFISHSCAF